MTPPPAGGPALIDAWVADVGGPPLVRETLTLDGLRSGEVLVRVEAVGVCHTDIAWVNGSRPSPFPLIAGHEGAGVVAATGEGVAGFDVGDRVVMSFASCGSCRPCLTGRPAYCHSFRTLNSGFGGGREQEPRVRRASGEHVTAGFFGQSSFADHALTTPRNLVRLPDWAPTSVAAPFGCGVQTGAGAVLTTFGMRPGQSLVVFGAGAVGMSAVMAAAVAGGGTVVAVDPVERRRELALQLGATHALTPAEVASGALRAILADGFDWALDTSGRPEVVRSAVEALHSTGTVGLVAAGQTGAELAVPLRDLIVGRRVCGLVEGDAVPQVFIPRLLELWRDGRFPVDALLSVWPAEDINDALSAMVDGTAVKPVVRFGPA
ncbi:MAG: Alcohol dehydrogenase, zinc-binding protein [Frankiales bacterium]|nr:Alcohol dehydrogenase, zinc-binding protein [Frankiales bacterium]